MWPYLIVPVLFAAAGDSDDVLRELTANCQTGSLLFSQGDCLAVKVFSKSRFTHCGAVVIEDGKPVVYDAMNGTGVRRTELADYLRLQTPSEIQAVHPATPLTESETAAFAQHLASQVGRQYGIKHHLTGKRANGIHCAEYCTDALMAAGRIESDNPPRVSPGGLYAGLTTDKLYTDGGKYELRPNVMPAPVPENESWCRWAWRETCECTTGCGRQMSRWFLCREK